MKSSINLAAGYHFAGVRFKKKAVRVGFYSDKRIGDGRIVETEVLGTNWFAYAVDLGSASEIDEQLLSWLEAAYRLRAEQKEN